MESEDFQTVWGRLEQAFQPERAKGIDAEIQLDVEGEGQFYLVVRDQTVRAETGQAPNPRLKLKANRSDLSAIFQGKLDPGAAFFQGRLNVQGDMGLAMKLVSLFK